MYATFVDYEKAFYSVDREVLWKLLSHYGSRRNTSSSYKRPMRSSPEGVLVVALFVPANHRLDYAADDGEISQWHTVDP